MIGFDVREMHQPYLSEWSAERIQTYLLKQQVEKPLSVDRIVWSAALAGAPNNALNNLDLWRNSNVMKQFFIAMSRTTDNALPVAFTLFCDDNISLEYLDLIGIDPETIPPHWKLMGYDVADAGQISGLTNCGYNPPEIADYSGFFGDHLNEYHLLTDLNMAFIFAEMTDDRVSEHAPFYVYGIYRI